MAKLESLISELLLKRESIQGKILDNEFELDKCESNKECRNLKEVQTQRYTLIGELHGIEREIKNIFLGELLTLTDQLTARYPDIEIYNISQRGNDICLCMKMKPKKVLGLIKKLVNFNNERFYEFKRNILKIHPNCYVAGKLVNVDEVAVVINISTLEDEGYTPIEFNSTEFKSGKYLT